MIGFFEGDIFNVSCARRASAAMLKGVYARVARGTRYGELNGEN